MAEPYQKPAWFAITVRGLLLANIQCRPHQDHHPHSSSRLEDHLGFSQRSAHLCIQATPQSLLGPQARESPGLVRSLVWSWALVSVAWRGGWQPPHCDTDLRWKVPSCAQTFLCTWHLWGSWGAPRSPSSHLQVHLPPSPESFLHLLSHVQQFTLCAGGCSLFLSSGSSA